MHKMGAAAELGLVTTPEEFIPRAGAVNLHTYVFGRSVNFAEVLIPLETFLLHLFWKTKFLNWISMLHLEHMILFLFEFF